jgi:hypothetical protein
MKHFRPTRLHSFIVALILLTLACSSATPEPQVTDTPLPPPTHTPRPTATPRPTQTPNLAATEQYEEFGALLDSFLEAGYIDSTDGEIKELDTFNESWPQINWYQWWPVSETFGDFVFKGHFEWSTASATPEDSGCGIVFGVQENNDHYGVFLTHNRILFLMNRGTYSYEVGKTRGSGRVNFTNPAESDFAIAVKGQSAFVVVDDVATEYTLSADQTTKGQFAYSLLSGTNKEYGTRCEMSDLMLWQAR